MFLLKSTEKLFVVAQTSSFVAQKLLMFLSSHLVSALTQPLTKIAELLVRLVLDNFLRNGTSMLTHIS
jgi:hypothetical protein